MQNEWRVIAQKHACCPNSVSMRKPIPVNLAAAVTFIMRPPGNSSYRTETRPASRCPCLWLFMSESTMRKLAKSAPHVLSFPKKCKIDALHGAKRSKRILIAGFLATFPRNVCISNEKARFSIRVEENLPRNSSFAHYSLQEHSFRA